MVTVFLSSAILCISTMCYPVLVGKNTPLGTFQLVKRLTETNGYGGDVIQFHETEHEVYAIHRIWKLSPKQNREARIRSNNEKDRIITAGCINVTDDVYGLLNNCCTPGDITIVP